MNPNDVYGITTNAEEYKPEEPQPLRKKMGEPKLFPVDILPLVLSNAVKAIHNKIQAPLPICAQSVLATASLAVQGHANVVLPMGQERPLSCSFLSIAESGDRKSSADNEAMFPITEYQKTLNEQYQKDLISYKNNKEIYECEKQQLLKGKNKKSYNPEDLLKKLNNLKEPIPPIPPLLICEDPTLEGLHKFMATSHPSLGLFTTEGSQFLGGYSMGKDHKLKSAGALSKLWDGGNLITRIRAGDSPLILSGKRLSLHLMSQPEIARQLLSDEELQDQGLLSRFLIVAPQSLAGTRFSKRLDQTVEVGINKYHSFIRDLLNVKLPLKEKIYSELEFRALHLTEKAKEIWFSYSDEIERKLIAGGQMEPIKSLANKLPEHAARLAGILSLIEDINCKEIDEKNLCAGLELAQYYAEERLRLTGAYRVPKAILLAERLLNWLHNNWDKNLISLPDIYQKSLNAIKTKKQAEPIVKTLEDHGWLIKSGPAVVNNIPRKNVWKIMR